LYHWIKEEFFLNYFREYYSHYQKHIYLIEVMPALKLDENDELKKRIINIENDYKVKIKLLTQENEELKNNLKLSEEEYEANINKLNSTIETNQKNSDNYINDLLKQISELKNIIQGNEIKIKNLTNDINNMQKEIDKYKKMEEKYIALISTNDDNVKEINILKNELEKLKNEFDLANKNYEEEINKLNSDIEQYLSEIDDLKKQLDELINKQRLAKIELIDIVVLLQKINHNFLGTNLNNMEMYEIIHYCQVGINNLAEKLRETNDLLIEEVLKKITFAPIFSCKLDAYTDPIDLNITINSIPGKYGHIKTEFYNKKVLQLGRIILIALHEILGQFMRRYYHYSTHGTISFWTKEDNSLYTGEENGFYIEYEFVGINHVIKSTLSISKISSNNV